LDVVDEDVVHAGRSGGDAERRSSPASPCRDVTEVELHSERGVHEEREFAERYGWGPEMIDTIPRTLAGWHTLLDQLSSVLAGKGPLPEAYWKGLHQHYLARV
jgi:hypothetical protein